MDKKIYDQMNDILKAEIKPAFGCTGPIGIAYATAEARDAVGGTPVRIKITADKDMCAKNGDVGIPSTTYKGIEIAACLGAFAGDASKKLEVLKGITPEDEKRAYAFARAGDIQVIPDWETEKIGVFIEAEVETENGIGKAIVAKTHSNLVYKAANDTVLVDEHFERIGNLDETKDPITEFGIADFYEYATTIPIEELYWLREALQMNRALSEKALSGSTGIGLAAQLMENAGGDIIRRAKAWAAAGSEARMGGLNMSTMACATSGNVGITGSMPLMSLAEDLGKSEEDLLRAPAFSYYVTCLGKNRIGRHSAMCACVVAASCGVAAGTSLLLGGDLQTAMGAINNTVCNVFGVVCDGARYACALKLSSAVGIAIEGAMLAKKGVILPANEGVTGQDGQATIEFLGQFAKKGMIYTDKFLCQELYKKLPSIREV